MTKKHCDPPLAGTGAGQGNTSAGDANSTVSTAGINARLVDCDHAATYLCIGKRKLWQLTNCGAIACVRIGRSVRYDFADLDAFVARHRKGGQRK